LSLENKRTFFVEFAKNAGFDPLVPGNWHKVTARQLKAKGALFLLRQYKHKSYKQAITEAFPELSFDPQWPHRKREKRPDLIAE